MWPMGLLYFMCFLKISICVSSSWNYDKITFRKFDDKSFQFQRKCVTLKKLECVWMRCLTRLLWQLLLQKKSIKENYAGKNSVIQSMLNNTIYLVYDMLFKWKKIVYIQINFFPLRHKNDFVLMYSNFSKRYFVDFTFLFKTLFMTTVKHIMSNFDFR